MQKIISVVLLATLLLTACEAGQGGPGAANGTKTATSTGTRTSTGTSTFTGTVTQTQTATQTQTQSNTSTATATQAKVAAKPYMGFSTYYAARDLQKFQVNQASITQIAKDMKAYGLKDAGYNLLSVDIGWWYSTTNSPRDPNTHQIIPSPLISNIQGMASDVHAQGILLGLYTDTGKGDAAGCGGFPGSGGYIQQDILQMIGWGVDMIKVDHCGGNPNAKAAGISNAYGASDYEYGLWSKAIQTAAQSTGKQLIFDAADWNFSDRTNAWAGGLANSWRTQSDIDYRVFKNVNGQYVYDPADPSNSPVSWKLVLRNFLGNDVAPAAGPGHWNNPDYLMIGGYGLSATEEQSQFNMWVIQSAPLILATYPADLAPGAPDAARLRAMLLNPEVIAIDQDDLGRQGEKVREDQPGLVVYSKMLAGNGRRAVLLLNENESAGSVKFTLGDLGLAASAASVRDLVSRRDLGSFQTYSANLPAHGSMLLLVQGTEATAPAGAVNTLGIKVLGNPAVLVSGGAEYEAALGLDRYYYIRSGGQWSRIRPGGCGGDVIFFGSPSLTYVNGAINLVGLGYVDAWGANQDSVTVRHTYSYDGGKTWACYGDLGKPSAGIYDQLGLVSVNGTVVDVFGRGKDNSLYVKRWDGAAWSGWQAAGACVHSGVGTNTRGNGYADLVAIGCDDKVWHGWYSSPTNINWGQVSSPESFVNTPASSWDGSEFRAFATAESGREMKMIRWNASSGWSGWTGYGRCLKNGVSVSGNVAVGTGCNSPGKNADTDLVGDQSTRIAL